LRRWYYPPTPPKPPPSSPRWGLPKSGEAMTTKERSIGARLSRHFSRVVPGLRPNSPRVTNDRSLATLVFFTVALFSLPATASPLCESAVSYEYRNTSTPRPKWAVSECRSVQKAARVFGVRESLAVAVAAHESDFKPWALSHAGAAGTMQVKPAYHCPVWMFGLKWCTTRGQWVRAGVRHLAELLDDHPEPFALRAYNAGRRGARMGRGERYMDAVRAAERRVRL